MFITLVDEKAGTEKTGLLVEITHDGTRGTIFVLDAETGTATLEPRIPNGAENAYVDDDGKHGQYFREGDPTSFPVASPQNTYADSDPEPDEDDVENTETTYG